MTLAATFATRGWLRFPADAAMRAWASHALPRAIEVTQDPAQAHWLRCGGTWFVGVDALPNDERGRVGDGPPLAGGAVDFIRDHLGPALPLHPAQVSVCYPGYPRPSAEESETAFGFRLRRDAAHVDGLLAEGTGRRRFLREPHAFILGIGLTAQSPEAAPLTVWDGSHHIMGEMFASALAGVGTEQFGAVDLTEAYQAARRRAFAACPRIPLPSAPGEAVLLHRHLLHGVAPWGPGAAAPPEGRMIAYFRPICRHMADWLPLPADPTAGH